jgi:hypothetical protein
MSYLRLEPGATLPRNDLIVMRNRLQQLSPLFSTVRDQRILERTIWSLSQLINTIEDK